MARLKLGSWLDIALLSSPSAPLSRACTGYTPGIRSFCAGSASLSSCTPLSPQQVDRCLSARVASPGPSPALLRKLHDPTPAPSISSFTRSRASTSRPYATNTNSNNSPTMSEGSVDILIVGGGPAGLTTSVAVARNQHSAICFDSRQYRNERTNHFHMIPTWDGKDPLAFRDAARKNTLENYSTTSYVDTTIVRTTKLDDGFEVEDDKGKTWKGKTLVLASGIEDVYPNIAGYDECWARSIFHCLFCHGYEQRGAASAGVLAIDDVAKPPFALHVARNAAQLVKEVTIYTNVNPGFAAALQPMIGDKAPFKVDDRKIASFKQHPSGEGLTITFEDGSTKDEAFIAHKPVSKVRGPFADQLGLERMPDGDIKVFPPFNETSVKGCFAAGDNSSFLKTSANAINTGCNVSAGVASTVQAAKYGQKSLPEMMAEMMAKQAQAAKAQA